MPITSAEKIYLFLCGLSLLICAVSLILLRRADKAKTAQPLSLLAGAIIGWLVFSALAILFDQHAGLVKASSIAACLVSLLVPICFLYFSRIVTTFYIQWRNYFWLWPIVFFLVIFLPGLWGQPLVTIHLTFVPKVGYRARILHSPISEIIVILNYAIALLAHLRLVYGLLKVNPHFKRIAMALVFTLLMPIVYSLSKSFTFYNDLAAFDYTPLLLAVTIISLTLFIQKTKISNLNILSREVFFDDLQNGMIIVDDEGYILDINHSAAKMLGELKQKEVLQKNLQPYFPFNKLPKQHSKQTNERPDFVWHSPSQQEFEIFSRQLRNANQELSGFMITFVDVTELNQLLRQTHELSIRDTLTRAFNRRHFEAMTAKQFANAARYGNPISIMMIDLDDFKRINDTYGHLAGDKILIKAADNFFQEVREADTVARYDGDEFVILLPNTPLQGAIQVAQRILRRCQITEFDFIDEKNVLSTSIGISSWYSKPGEKTPINHESLLNQADQALYYAKNSPTIHMAYYESGTFRIIPSLKYD